MAGALGGHFAFQPPGLPVLKFCRRHINCQRFFCKHTRERCAAMGFAKCHGQGKFLKRAVELSMNIVAEKLRAERNFLSEPAEANDEVKAMSLQWSGRQSVDCACTFQTNTAFRKPLR